MSIFTTKPLLFHVINEYLSDNHDGWVAFMHDNNNSNIYINNTYNSSTSQWLLVRTDVQMLKAPIIYTSDDKSAMSVSYNPYTEETILQQITEHINKCKDDNDME